MVSPKIARSRFPMRRPWQVLIPMDDIGSVWNVASSHATEDEAIAALAALKSW